MSRTVYDLVREANWLKVERAGFGSITRLHITCWNRPAYCTEVVELPHDAGMVEIWERAWATYSRMFTEMVVVAQVTKALTL